MPQQSIIDSLKGKLDFYYWKGIPCVRSWPRWPPRDPTPPEKANQDTFSYINKLYITLPDAIKQTYIDQAASTSLTSKDLFVKLYYLGGLA